MEILPHNTCYIEELYIHLFIRNVTKRILYKTLSTTNLVGKNQLNELRYTPTQRSNYSVNFVHTRSNINFLYLNFRTVHSTNFDLVLWEAALMNSTKNVFFTFCSICSVVSSNKLTYTIIYVY